MSTRLYTLPVEQTRWSTPQGGEVTFDWEYDEGRDKLLRLYEKGKRLQWSTGERLDWSHELDPGNPLQVADMYISLASSPVWAKLDEKGKAEARRHIAAWQLSQFLHGEQGALICTARIVTEVPNLDSKFYAATQVMDEARHVEVFSRLLRDKLALAYPINPNLRTLLDQILRDGRWDYCYLGMQILIEGLALAAFGLLRDTAGDPLVRAINTYVMQDETRHVAFGRVALRDYYPHLTDRERAEREEFCVEACYLMRDRFVGEEIWRHLGFGDQVLEDVRTSLAMREFQRLLFSRIVPALKDIGLWGPQVQRAFNDMGVLGFAETDLDALAQEDEERARQLDQALAARRVD